MTIIGGTNYSEKQIARHFEGNVTREGAAKVRERYLAHKMTYVTAHAQLTVFFGFGDNQADLFLSRRDTAGEDTISACVNGRLSTSNACRELMALGISADEAKARIKAAWEGK